MKKQVRETLNESINKMSKKILSLNWQKQEFYEEYLAQTYFYVTHSCKLLKYSADKLKSGELYNCMIHHIEEESGHEKMAMHDLNYFGKKPADFTELKITKKIYDDIYNELDTVDPVAPLLGYAMALEGLSAAVAPKLSQLVSETYSPKAATFLKLHGIVDQEHAQDSENTLDLLTDEQLEIVNDSIKRSTSRYLSLLDEISSISIKLSNAS